MSTQRLLMWALASFFYAYQYILRVLPSITMTDILRVFSINATQFGQISGFYYLGYAGGQIPIGLLLDRFGSRKVLPLCIILTALGLLPLIIPCSWEVLLIGRFLIGLGSSGAILGVFKVIYTSFPTHTFNRMLGLSVTIGLFGAIYGGKPLDELLSDWGFEKLVVFLCIVSFLLACAVYRYIHLPALSSITSSPLQKIKSLLSNKTVWFMCLCGGLMVGPLEGFADVWGTRFLSHLYSIETQEAAQALSYIFLGMCFGAPFLTYIADHFKIYSPTIIVSGLGMALGFIVLFYVSLTMTLLKTVLFAIGVLCAYQIPVLYQVGQEVHKDSVALATSWANMIIMAFGYIFHTSIGQIMDFLWTGAKTGSLKSYDLNTYISSLSIIPLGLIIGSVGFMCIHGFLKKRVPN